jgi:hypothetical protein
MADDQKQPEDGEATLLPPREVMSLINPMPTGGTGGADGLASLGPLVPGDSAPAGDTSGAAGGLADTAGSTASHAQTFVPPHDASGASVSDQPQNLQPGPTTDTASSQT